MWGACPREPFKGGQSPCLLVTHPGTRRAVRTARWRSRRLPVLDRNPMRGCGCTCRAARPGPLSWPSCTSHTVRMPRTSSPQTLGQSRSISQLREASGPKPWNFQEPLLPSTGEAKGCQRRKVSFGFLCWKEQAVAAVHLDMALGVRLFSEPTVDGCCFCAWSQCVY